MIQSLAGFGPVGELGMIAGFRQVQGPRIGCNQTDKSLADPQRSLMHRVPVKAFGRIQFQSPISAQRID